MCTGRLPRKHCLVSCFTCSLRVEKLSWLLAALAHKTFAACNMKSHSDACSAIAQNCSPSRRRQEASGNSHLLARKEVWKHLKPRWEEQAMHQSFCDVCVCVCISCGAEPAVNARNAACVKLPRKLPSQTCLTGSAIVI